MSLQSMERLLSLSLFAQPNRKSKLELEKRGHWIPKKDWGIEHSSHPITILMFVL